MLHRLLLLPLAFLATSCVVEHESKEKAWLRKCEDQVKAQLSNSTSYQQSSALGSDFIPVPELSSGDKETVLWEFFYEGEKPATVVGQAGERPLLKGIGQCEINKRTGTVKAERVS